MKTLTRGVAAAAVMIFSAACWANGGPVAWTQGKPSGGIAPQQENAIELVREDLEISVLDLNRYSVEASYLLSNPVAAKRVKYGVPLYWVEKFDPKAAAAGIRISVEGKVYGCNAVNPIARKDADSMERAEMLGGIGDAWCVADIEIPKGSSVQLKLSYRAELEFEDWEFSKSARTEFSQRSLKYPLAPAGYWHGTPDLLVHLNLGPYAGHIAKASPDGFSKAADALTWKVAGANLKKLGQLAVDFRAEPLLEHRQLATWNAVARPNQRSRGKLDASSTLAHPGNRHSVAKLMDGDPTTAWCEGREGNGEGESLTVRFDAQTAEPYCSPEGIAIIPGYAKSAQTYLQNGRVSKLRIEDCGDPSSYVVIRLPANEDFNQSAVFIGSYGAFIPDDAVAARGGNWARAERTNGPVCLRFTILETLPGSRFSDTCISELAFIRNCG